MYQKEYDTSTPDFFTFQSGSIQIIYSFRQGQLRQNFTFQSGSIQILERTFVNLQQSPLHSNLVLFKSKSKDGYFRAKVLYIPIWFYSNFTCVYTINDITVLYIPIWFYSNAKVAKFKLLQAGLYIPIWFYSNNNCIFLVCNICSLYIPIWFYSNQTVFLNKLCQACFTFQSGSIQIASINLYPLPGKHFTFQSGSIQMVKRLQIKFICATFTFQSGSIQIETTRLT